MPENIDKLLTVSALADYFGIDRRTVKKFLAGVPPAAVKRGHRLYTLGMMERAIEAARKRPATAKQAVEIEVLQERLKKLRFDNECDRKLYVLKEDVSRLIQNVGRYQISVLRQQLEVILPPRLAGLNPIEIGQRMQVVVDEVIRLHNDGLKQFMLATPKNHEHETPPNTDPRAETPSNPSPNQAPAGGGSTTQGTPGTASA